MRIIKEFLLERHTIAPQTAYLPKDAKVLAVQNTDKGLMLYALVDPVKFGTDLRTFKICDTSENIYEDNISYIGSYNTDFCLRHVIEIL